MRCSRSECACHASVSFGGHMLPLKDDMDRGGNWEKHDEPILVRRRNDGRDPPGGGMAATAFSRDRVGCPMAALRRLRASGGDDWLQWGLQHSRRSCVHLSHIGARNLARLPVVHGRPAPMKVVGTVLGVIGLLFSSWWR